MTQRADTPEYRDLRIERLTDSMLDGLRLIYASGDQLLRMLGPYEANRIWLECARRVAEE